MTQLPIAYVTTRHRCPHCRKSYSNKANAAKHMERCFSDPERRTCKTCRWQAGPYEDTGYDCARGEEMGPSCVGCGEHPEVCGCPDRWRYKPALHLRVLCPSWEAKP